MKGTICGVPISDSVRSILFYERPPLRAIFELDAGVTLSEFMDAKNALECRGGRVLSCQPSTQLAFDLGCLSERHGRTVESVGREERKVLNEDNPVLHGCGTALVPGEAATPEGARGDGDTQSEE